jgi:hypothetical protein
MLLSTIWYKRHLQQRYCVWKGKMAKEVEREEGERSGKGRW